MNQILKGIVVSLIVVVILFTVFTLFSNDEFNVRQSQEVNTVLESSNVGTLRASFEEDYEGGYGVDIQTLVNELKLEVSERYRGIDKVGLSYVFFNDEDTIYNYSQAEDRDDIVGIQFEITTYDEDGEELSTSTERRTLDRAEVE